MKNSFKSTLKPHSLIWFCSSRTPYNDYLFRNIAQDDRFDLVVVYKNKIHSDYPWKKLGDLGYKNHQMEFGGFDKAVMSLIFRRNSTIILGGWQPSFWLILFLLIFNKAKFFVWSDTPNLNAKRGLFKSIIRNTILRFVFKHSYLLLCTGSPCVEIFKSMGAPKNKLVNFPIHVMPSNISEDDLFLKDGVIKFVVIGRLIPIKSVETALHALAIVNSSNPKLKFFTSICGDGPDRKHLEGLAEKLNLKEKVNFLGWLEANEVQNTLQDSDVLLHPAKWEPYGAVILEAMENGLAILASSNTIGALDRIEPNVEGLIHEAQNIEDLASHIELLALDRKRLHKMQKASLKKARSNNIKKTLNQLSKLMEFNGAINEK